MNIESKIIRSALRNLHVQHCKRCGMFTQWFCPKYKEFGVICNACVEKDIGETDYAIERTGNIVKVSIIFTNSVLAEICAHYGFLLNAMEQANIPVLTSSTYTTLNKERENWATFTDEPPVMRKLKNAETLYDMVSTVIHEMITVWLEEDGLEMVEETGPYLPPHIITP